MNHINTKLPKQKTWTYSEVSSIIGDCIRFHRLLKGMSQKRLGKALGVTFQNIQKYEAGTINISVARLYHLSRIFDVPVQSLYGHLIDCNEDDQSETEKEARNVLAFVESHEGFELNRAFDKIKDPQVKRKIVDLVKSIPKEVTNNEQ